MELRTYQQEARTAIHKQWYEGHRRTLLVLPTGTGKTVVFAKIVEDQVKTGDRVLILAHRGELLDQAADKLERVTGLKCAVEKAEQSCLDSWYRVTVGSVQSLQQERRLARFPADYFGTIIIDEAHHAITDGYRRILDHFEDAKVLGVTATPDRGDMRDLGEVFDSLAYEYTLAQAIKEKHLVPIKALTVPLKLDISAVGTQAGDFKPGELDTALDPYLRQIAAEMAQTCPERKIVVFLPLIRTSKKFCKILHEYGFRAIEVNGNSEDRAQIIRDFADGVFNVICNSMLLTEGWDCPDVDCVVVLRPTKVRSLYCQMIGRGTRPAPGKSDLLILDFLWHTARHELCRPAALIAKTDDVARKMTEAIAENGGAVDLTEAEAQAETDVAEEREAALAAKLKEMRTRKRKLVDPLQYQVSILDRELDYMPTFAHEMTPPTDKQRQTLEKFGIFPDGIETSGAAARLIGMLIDRSGKGLTTPRQIRFLESKGFEHVGTWQFEAAKKLIDRIAGNGWRVPYDINPATYKPKAEKEVSPWDMI